MNSAVEPLPDAPIVIVSLQPHTNIDREVQDIAAAVADLINEMGSPLVVIHDFSDYDVSFPNMVQKLASETQGLPGSLSDERVIPMFVGRSAMVELGAQSFAQKQYGDTVVLLFADLDDAVDYARRFIQVQ